jgi:serine/threonine-protein kinase HipA
LEFLDRIIFNFLVGNGDAHGKNFSVLYRDGAMELAPMYDVMSTAIYPEVGKKMAMKIDGEYAFKWITTEKFLRMAKTIGLGDRVMRRELDKMERRVSRVLPRMVKAAQKRWPSFCYGEIAVGINKRIAQLNGKQKD